MHPKESGAHGTQSLDHSRSPATPILKTLNALRFKRVVRIDSQDDLRFRPGAIASVLTQYVRKHAPQDVLLLGRQTSVGENAKTHLLTAEMLGWPCITQVAGIELVDREPLEGDQSGR